MSVRVSLTAIIAVVLLTCATAARAQAQDEASCTSSIRVLMNQYGTEQIPAGATIWFSGVLQGVLSAKNDLGTVPVRIDVRDAQITFGKWPYTVKLPDSTIQLDPTATDPQRWWVDRSAWSVTLSPSRLPEAFFDGAPFTAPEPFLPGDSGPMTWTATFTASRPGITLTWAWSAAVYSQFGPNGRLLVKPLSAPIGEPQPSRYQNDDPAGTPELYRQYVVAGAMGSGASQYTGTRSKSATVHPCVSTQPVPPKVTLVHTSAQSRVFSGGTVSQVSGKCDTTDLCASIDYPNGDRVAIYSEGGTRCDRYMLYITRTDPGRTVFAFSRSVASLCGNAVATLSMDAGRIRLAISRNADGSLKFAFEAPK